jgi:hypothetical protein
MAEQEVVSGTGGDVLMVAMVAVAWGLGRLTWERYCPPAINMEFERLAQRCVITLA